VSNLSEYAKIFRVLGHPDRIRILRVIEEFGEVYVCELVEALGISFYSVSKHLKELRFAGLLKESRKGRFVMYSFSELDEAKRGFICCLLSIDDAIISEDIERFKVVTRSKRPICLEEVNVEENKEKDIKGV